MKGKDRDKLLIRKQSLLDKKNHRRHEAPLCGGYSLFYLDKKPQVVTGEKVHRVKLRLALNPQRFTRHQPQNDNPLLPFKLRLQKRGDDRSVHGDECSFDGEDNWIPETPVWKKFATKDRVPDYLNLVVKQVESDFKRACKHLDVTDDDGWHELDFYRSSEDYSLSAVENLWEFPSDNPLMDVVEIGTKLLHLKGKSGTAKLNHLEFKDAGRILNSPCFSIPIAEGVRLKLYAKTNKRIRFEVVQSNLSKQRSDLLKEAGIPLNDGERSWDELPLILQALRVRATKHMNQVMVELRKGRTETVRSLSVVHLLAEIAAAVPFSFTKEARLAQIQTLMVWLCYQRGYRGRLKKGPYAVSLANLEKRGVLKFERARQFYILADAYTKAADDLLGVTGEPLLNIFGMNWGGYALSKDGKSPVRLRE